MNYLDPPGQNRVFVFFWAGLSSRGGVLLCLFFPAGAVSFFSGRGALRKVRSE